MSLGCGKSDLTGICLIVGVAKNMGFIPGNDGKWVRPSSLWESGVSTLADLDRRLRAHRRRALRRSRMNAWTKRQFMRACALMVAFAMVLSFTGLPPAHAYFTGETKQSGVLAFKIPEATANTQGSVQFLAPFLMQDDESVLLQEEAPGLGVMSLSPFGGTMQNPIFSGPATLTAEIWLEDDFSAGDIYVPSVELHHGGYTASALTTDYEFDGERLSVTFDRFEILSWFADQPDQPEQVTFDVTGEGYRDGLDHFTFFAAATVKLRGSYETVAVEIIGLDAFLIPESGDVSGGIYKLVNQKGTVLDEVTWLLEGAPADGVTLDVLTGELMVHGDVAPGTVTLSALTVQDERRLSALKMVHLVENPGLAIEGPFAIPVPGPGQLVGAQYALTAQTGTALGPVSWTLDEAIAGVSCG